MNWRKITEVELILLAFGIEAVGAILSAALLFSGKVSPSGTACGFAIVTALAIAVLIRGVRMLWEAKRQQPMEYGKDGRAGDDLRLPTVGDIGPQPEDSTEDRPWEEVPDKGYDRKMLELWHAGFSAREIGWMVGKDLSEQTILNRASQLRKRYGDRIVPRRR
jgi:hypothetical protein